MKKLSEHDIKKYFPVGLTEQERNWWALVLKWEFPERKRLLGMLQTGELTITSKSFGLDFTFDNVLSFRKLAFEDRYFLEVDARSETMPPVSAMLRTWKGKVDELYIYTVDGQDLDLDLTSYNDFEFGNDYYKVSANESIRRLYAFSGNDGMRREKLLSTLIEKATSKREQITGWLMPSIRTMHGCEEAVLYDSGPFSVSVRIPLGKKAVDGDKVSCYGIIKVSLLADFHCAYAVLSGRTLGLTDQYPHGERLLATRELLLSKGFLPLTNGFLRSSSEFHPFGLEEATIGDCLFSGRGLSA